MILYKLSKILVKGITVPFFELFYEIEYFLRSTLFSEKARIIETENAVKKNVCILILFQPCGIHESILLTIKELSEKGFSVILVANHQVDREYIDKFRELCFSIIIRSNFGRDFGGFKYTIKHLHRNGLLDKLDSLLLMNDSAFFPVAETDSLFNFLSSDSASFIGASENYLPKYHLQSYFLYFKKDIIRSKTFYKFWEKYRSKSSRRHIILKGEVRLTRYFKKNGFLSSCYLDYERFLKITDTRQATPASELFLTQFLLGVTEKKRAGNSGSLNGVVGEKSILKIMLKKFFENNSIIHHSGLLLPIYTSFPFLKKDLLKKGFINYSDLTLIDQFKIPAEEKEIINKYYKLQLKTGDNLLDKIMSLSLYK